METTTKVTIDVLKVFPQILRIEISEENVVIVFADKTKMYVSPETLFSVWGTLTMAIEMVGGELGSSISRIGLMKTIHEYMNKTKFKIINEPDKQIQPDLFDK